MNPSIALAVAVVVDDPEAAAGAGAVESKGGDDGALAAPDTEVPDPNYVPEVSIACLLHCRATSVVASDVGWAPWKCVLGVLGLMIVSEAPSAAHQHQQGRRRSTDPGGAADPRRRYAYGGVYICTRFFIGLFKCS